MGMYGMVWGGLGIHGDPWGSRSRIPRGSPLRPFEAQPRAPGLGPGLRTFGHRAPGPGPIWAPGLGMPRGPGPEARGTRHHEARSRDVPGHPGARPVPGCPGGRGPGPRAWARGTGSGHVRTPRFFRTSGEIHSRNGTGGDRTGSKAAGWIIWGRRPPAGSEWIESSRGRTCNDRKLPVSFKA